MSNSLKINNSSSVFNPKNQSITDNIDTYSLIEIPDAGSEWVIEAREGILFHIDLEDLISDLSNAGDLIYLASNGAKRVDVGISLEVLQGNLLSLYGTCLQTMNKFADSSMDASTTMKNAFNDLFNGEENSAIFKLNSIAKMAREMNAEATTISNKFNAFKLEVQDQSKTLQLKVITSYDELDELNNARNDLQANASKQRSLEKELQISIAELTEDLEEAKATAKAQENQAFVLQLLGGLFSAVGAGLGAYSMSKNPVAMVSKVAVDTTQIIKDSNQQVDASKDKLDPDKKKELERKIEEQKTATEEKDKAEAEVKDIKKVVEKFDAEIAQAVEEKKSAENEIVAADKQIKEVNASNDENKEKAIKIANTAKEEAEDKISEKELLIKNKTKRKSRKETELVDSNKKLLTAEEKWQTAKAAVDVFSAGVNKLGETVDKMSVKAEKRAETARDTMTEILKLKREVQKAKREATSEIELLVGKLIGNADKQERRKNTIHCLEISIWALMNLFVTFERASFFWSNIALAAKKLSDPKIQKLVREIIKNTEGLEERIYIYKDEDFTRMSISSVVGWKALNSICVEYVDKVDDVNKKVEMNKANNLTIAQATRALDVMKSDLKNKLSFSREEALKKENMLENNIEEIKSVKLATAG